MNSFLVIGFFCSQVFQKKFLIDLKILCQPGSQVDYDYATMIECGCSKVLLQTFLREMSTHVNGR